MHDTPMKERNTSSKCDVRESAIRYPCPRIMKTLLLINEQCLVRRIRSHVDKIIFEWYEEGLGVKLDYSKVGLSMQGNRPTLVQLSKEQIND